MRAFIDIHTHQFREGNSISVVNLAADFGRYTDLSHCSLGLHPWYLGDSASVQRNLESLKNFAYQPQVLGIGECGLDKVCNTPWDLQEEAFQVQIHLANQMNKPLIIHCVRAFGEVLALLQKHKNKIPVIFHGFNKSLPLAESLLKKGFYLSFGADLLKRATLREVLRSCPLSQVFLETDNSGLPIEQLYTTAAQLFDRPQEYLAEQFFQNFKHLIHPRS